ncbi:MAG: hypothetical protein R3F30_07525 [Planctomycetota bacterium]
MRSTLHAVLILLAVVASLGAQSPRERLRVRVLGPDGVDWAGGTVVATSRPGPGCTDRVEGRLDDRGRAQLALLPGRSYSAWAWVAVPGKAGRYRVTKLETEVAGNSDLRLHGDPDVQTELEVSLKGLEAWKGPFRVAGLSFTDGGARRYERREWKVEGGRFRIGPVPSGNLNLFVYDAKGRLVLQHGTNLQEDFCTKAFEAAEKQRKEKAEKEAAEKKGEAGEKKGEAGDGEAKDGEGAKPDGGKDAGKAAKQDDKQDEKEGEEKASEKKKATANIVKVNGRAFQVVQLGGLVQGNAVVQPVNAQSYLEWLAADRLELDVLTPVPILVRVVDKESKKPLADARLFERTWDEDYEYGRTDADGRCVLVFGMRTNETTGLPLQNYLNFRVHARGCPETYVRRWNLKLGKPGDPEQEAAPDAKPLLTAEVTRGHVLTGRVLLTEGRPFADGDLLVDSGMDYDYGNNNAGFAFSQAPVRIRTDAEGRFEWPYADDRFPFRCVAVLDPVTLAALGGGEQRRVGALAMLVDGHGADLGKKAGKEQEGKADGQAPGAEARKAAEDAARKAAAEAERKAAEAQRQQQARQQDQGLQDVTGQDDGKKDGEKDGEKAEEDDKPLPEPVLRDLGDLRLDALVPLDVQVIGDDGRPASCARVGVANLANKQAYLVPFLQCADRFGRLRVLQPAAEAYAIGCAKDGQYHIEVAKIDKPTARELRLGTSLVLRGRIVDPNGDPVAGAQLWAWPMTQQAIPHQGLWNALRGGNTAYRSGEDGRFEIPVAAETTYNVSGNVQRGNQWYGIQNQMIEVDDRSVDLDDVEVPIPVEKKKQAAPQEAPRR